MKYKKSIIKNGVKKLVDNKPIRMHMPGHKGKKSKYKYDITEILGADNLHNSQGIIQEAQDKIAQIYGAEDSVLLVGSTTAGLQASIMASLDEGDEILVPINSHRAIYPALAFNRLNPVYYKPESKNPGMIVTPEIIEKELEKNPNVKALIIVSPDFFGNVSDIRKIKEITDKKGIILIVDQAHGAHLKFLPEIEDAVTAGADYVVESTHKILGAPTQGSILHMQNKANAKKAKKILAMIESSSPSYMIMAGIEEAVDEAEQKAETVFKKIYAAHDALMRNQSPDDPVQLIEPDGIYDKSKFILSVPNAHDLEQYIVEDLRVIPEMVLNDLVLCMTGIGTSQKDLNRFFGAISILNEKLKEEGIKPQTNVNNFDEILKPFNTKLPLYKVLGQIGERVNLEEAEGKVVTNFIVPYPPGIPILIPGSVVTKEDIATIKELINNKNTINGLEVINTEPLEVYLDVLDIKDEA